MARWHSLNPSTPAALNALADVVTTTGTALESALGAVETALGAASAFLQGTANPAAAAASTAVSQAQAFAQALLDPAVHSLVLHPWIAGLGHGQGAFRSLPHPVLRNAMAVSLDDTSDPQRPVQSASSPLESVCITVGAASPSLFASSLKSINLLLNLSQFALAARRIEQAFALNEARYTPPASGSHPPDWQKHRLTAALPGLEKVNQGVQAALSVAQGITAGSQSSVAVLRELITAKRRQVAALNTQLASAAQLFAGGIQGAGAYVLHAKNLAGAKGLRDALLRSSAAPQSEQSFCAGICLVAANGVLTPLAEVFA